MTQLRDALSVNSGRYRAFFGGEDLGKLASVPVIRAAYQSVRLPILNPTAADGRGEAESAPRLTGAADLNLHANDVLWRLLAEPAWHDGELRLLPEVSTDRVRQLCFPVARLLPVWEFEPASAGGVHVLRLHFRLHADSTGKLFVCA